MMSRNCNNWERLVAAVVKREQIWQLCHQDSISTVSSDYSSNFDLCCSRAPLSLGSSTHAFCITDTFKYVKRLKNGFLGITALALLLQDIQVSDSLYLEWELKRSSSQYILERIRTEDEFEQQMIVLGNCRHENVGTPWAYYFSKKEMIIVYDYYSEGSVFDMLRGLNWDSRVRIAVGAARGIAHIHAQCEGKLAHGNIKSSNIFVNSQGYGCVSDFSISPKQGNELSPSQESDVYRFGLVLLQLVTGASHVEASYIVRHLHSTPVFLVDELDVLEARSFQFLYNELMDSEEQQEVRRMLHVAKRCLSSIQERPRMHQVMLELEKIAELSAQKNASSGRRRQSRIDFSTLEDDKAMATNAY